MNHTVSRKSFIRGLTAMAGLTATGYSLSACTKPDTTSGNAPKVINFSILSVEKSQDLQDLWTPLLDDMAQQTGLTIKPFYASDYTALIEAMRFNQVQAVILRGLWWPIRGLAPSKCLGFRCNPMAV